jgi:DNA-binding response OmpR family regulator
MTKQVLLVEDEPDVARLVEFNLRGAGFEVTSVARGADALVSAKAQPPHVVVLDLMLPSAAATTSARRCAPTRPPGTSAC